MREIALLRNSIQEYAWGSKTAIAELLGRPAPADKPQAELWMGAHPKAPSQVFCGGVYRDLRDVIQQSPEEVLGARVVRKFSGRLPFLFKVLAAARPLSIQAHPNREQARQGFARENQAGIPLDSPRRNYKDENHKPEIICALTPFWALKGFRPIEEILLLLEKAQIFALEKETELLRHRPDREGLREFFQQLMSSADRQRLVSQAVSAAERHGGSEPLWGWIGRLQRQYPGDIGVLSPLLLNLVELMPAEALYLPPGELHAYLKGVGVELMANSDNVLRGGLTSKHVDIGELLAILTFASGKVNVLRPAELASGEKVYLSPAEEFLLSAITVSGTAPFSSGQERSVEILICTEGELKVTQLDTGTVIPVCKGTAILVPATVERYRIEGDGTVYKATVPG